MTDPSKFDFVASGLWSVLARHRSSCDGPKGKFHLLAIDEITSTYWSVYTSSFCPCYAADMVPFP